MLRRLCQTFHSHRRWVVVKQLDVLRLQTAQTSYQRRLNHNNFVNDFNAQSKEISEFLNKYPGAFRYPGAFSINVQPFSINAPHFYLRNFINDLGNTLKIPYVYEDGYSAAMCLEKICRTREKNSKLVTYANEGITREEWHELYLAIDDEIPYLDGRTLASLVSLNYKVKEFRKPSFEKIYLQFTSLLSHRDQLDVQDLCNWSDILLENECFQPKYVKLLETIWDIISRKNIQANELLTIYQSLPRQFNHLYKRFFGHFERHLPEMTVYDLFMIGMEIQRKSERTKEFQLMVGWIKNNLNQIHSEDLKAIVLNFSEAGYIDGFLLNILSRYIQQCERHGKPVDKNFIGLTVEYSTICCFYEPQVLDLACEMYIDSEEDYSYEELMVLLKSVGTLNHTPKRAYEFFTKVETFLLQEVFSIPPVKLLEIAKYLLFLDRPLFCLKEVMFSPSFQSIIGDLKESDPTLYRESLLQLNLLGNAFLEIGFNPFPKLDIEDRDLYQRLNATEYKEEMLYNDVVEALSEVIPKSYHGHFPRPTFKENYIELQYDKNGSLMEVKRPDMLTEPRYRQAIVILTDSAFCSLEGIPVSNHMLGTEIVNINVLKNQGVHVVVLKKNDITKHRKSGTLSKELRRLLLVDKRKVELFFKEQKELQFAREQYQNVSKEDYVEDFDHSRNNNKIDHSDDNGDHWLE